MKQEFAKILVVDDKPANLKVLLSFLKLNNFKVHIAENGERALRALKKHQPDLILMDVLMPGIDGFETCRQIKSSPCSAAIPVIFMTALDSVDDKVAGFNAGGVDYITKPFQQIEVLARITTHIALRKQKQQLERVQAELIIQKKLLEEISITDDLTGLHNRRYLNNVLEHEFQCSARHNSELTCLLFDLDHFKQVNDNYGHELGDNVLREFGNILKTSLRKGDFAFRFGGEEFLILLPLTNLTGAINAAEKIRLHTESANTSGIDLAITVSVGISSLKDHAVKNCDELINFADRALYRAKDNGRNQVVVYS